MGALIRGLLKLSIWVGIIAISVYAVGIEFFMDRMVVTHNGMAPTLVVGDEVLVWRGASVDMADVMVCEHPSRPGKTIMSRALIFAGHRISTDYNGVIYVDGKRTATEPQGVMRFYDSLRQKRFVMEHGNINYKGRHAHQYFLEAETKLRLANHKVESGVYMLGDNRTDRSNDSRAFGEVNPAKCSGQVFLRFKPAPDRDDDLQHFPLQWIE